MKKIVALSILLIVSVYCLSAQSPMYVILFKNGAKIECISYERTPKGDYVVDIDTIKYVYDAADVEEVVEIEHAPVRQTVEGIDLVDIAPQEESIQIKQEIKYATLAPPRKDPVVAGLLSFLVPGVGQFYNGNVGAGFGFMAGSILSYAVFFAGAITLSGEVVLLGLGGMLAVDIWSIVHAVKGAKSVNFSNGYLVGNDMYLNLEPSLLASNMPGNKKQYHYGASLSLTF